MDTGSRDTASRDRLVRGVVLQGLIAAFCTVLMSLIPARAESTLATGDAARTSIDLRVVVPTVLRIDALSQPDRLQVEARHVAQGYIELDEASLLRLTSNGRDGFNVSVAFDPGILSRVEVRMAGMELMAEAAGAAARVPNPPNRTGELRVSYRLHLTAGTVPGTYRWPVALSFSGATA